MTISETTPGDAVTLTLPQPNIPLLRKSIEWAEAEAAKPADQCLWWQEDYVSEKACGTAFCIAGYALSISPNVHMPTDGELPSIGGHHMCFLEAGQAVLGLGECDASHLFGAFNSIGDVRRIAEGIAERAGDRL